jgi:hypothetical protein
MKTFFIKHQIQLKVFCLLPILFMCVSLNGQIIISGKISEDSLTGPGLHPVTIKWYGTTSGSQPNQENGNYSISVPFNWSGYVKPEKSGYDFTPDSIDFEYIQQSSTGNNFFGVRLTYILNGVITDTLTNDLIEQVELKNQSGDLIAISDSSGQYEFVKDFGWSDTLIPFKTGHNFTPDTLIFNSLSGDTTVNLSAVLKKYVLSGPVRKDNQGLENVNLFIETNSNIVDGIYYQDNYEATTDNSGNYSIELYHGWMGTIRPYKYIHSFLPASREIAQALTGNLSVQEFTATQLDSLALQADDTALCLSESIELIPQVTGGEEPYHYEWWVDGSLVSEDAFLSVSPDITTSYMIKVSDTLATVTGTITVTVHELPDPELINVEGDTLVCANRAGAIYEIAEPQENHQYTFRLLSGGAVVDIGDIGNRIVINWEADTGTHILEVVAENQFGCISAKEVTIHISGAAAPLPAEIVRKTNSNILISMDTTAPNYQWGFINRSNWEVTKPAGAIGRFHNFDSGFNPDVNIYFVDRWFDDGGCISRSFFGSSFVGIHDLAVEEPFTVMPNPFTDFIMIASAMDTKAALTLVNQNGGVVLRVEAVLEANGHYRLNTGGLSRGIYLLLIEYDNRFFTTKVLKY